MKKRSVQGTLYIPRKGLDKYMKWGHIPHRDLLNTCKERHFFEK